MEMKRKQMKVFNLVQKMKKKSPLYSTNIDTHIHTYNIYNNKNKNGGKLYWHQISDYVLNWAQNDF